MSKVDYRLPTEDDIITLAINISPEDAMEIRSQGFDILWGLNDSIQNSPDCVAIFVDKRLVCITGLAIHSEISLEAFPWMVATEEIKDHRRELLKHSRLLLNRWLDQFPILTNYVDARHLRAIAWLRHLGAKFEYLHCHGPFSRPFYKFTFERG